MPPTISPQRKIQSEITDFTGKRRNQQKSPRSYAAAASSSKNVYDVLQDNEDEVIEDGDSLDINNSDDSNTTQKIDNIHQESTIGSDCSGSDSMHLDDELEFPALGNENKEKTMTVETSKKKNPSSLVSEEKVETPTNDGKISGPGSEEAPNPNEESGKETERTTLPGNFRASRIQSNIAKSTPSNPYQKRLNPLQKTTNDSRKNAYDKDITLKKEL
jgi:hypothetical protein